MIAKQIGAKWERCGKLPFLLMAALPVRKMHNQAERRRVQINTILKNFCGQREPITEKPVTPLTGRHSPSPRARPAI
jgi:hypothetical protein